MTYENNVTKQIINLPFGQRLHPNCCLTLYPHLSPERGGTPEIVYVSLAHVQHTNELFTWKESNITTMAGNMRTVLYFAIFCFVVNVVGAGEYSFGSKKLLYSCACPFYSLSSDHLVY